MPTKICTHCGEEKQVTDFYKDQRCRLSGGYTRLCKACTLQRNFPRLDREPEGKSYAERLVGYREINKRDYNKYEIKQKAYTTSR